MRSSILPTPPSSPSHSLHNLGNRRSYRTCCGLVNCIALGTHHGCLSPPRTLAALKTCLGIDGWQCGAETRNNTPRKRSVERDKRNDINAQLAVMKSLMCASPNFEYNMLKLMMLVHCHSHDAGQPKKCRREAWKLTFSPGSGDGTVLEVSTERVRKVFEPLNAECIAYNN